MRSAVSWLELQIGVVSGGCRSELRASPRLDEADVEAGAEHVAPAAGSTDPARFLGEVEKTRASMRRRFLVALREVH
jgi:hypothetical protein